MHHHSMSDLVTAIFFVWANILAYLAACPSFICNSVSFQGTQRWSDQIDQSRCFLLSSIMNQVSFRLRSIPFSTTYCFANSSFPSALFHVQSIHQPTQQQRLSTVDNLCLFRLTPPLSTRWVQSIRVIPNNQFEFCFISSCKSCPLATLSLTLLLNLRGLPRSKRRKVSMDVKTHDLYALGYI